MMLDRSAWQGSWRNWRSHLPATLSIAVAFICLAGALLLLTNLSAIERRYANLGRASVYLKTEATSAEVAELEQALLRAPYVESFRIISPEDARKEVLQASGADTALAGIGAGVFGYVIDLHFAQGANAQAVEAARASLTKIPYVDAVDTYENWSAQLESLMRSGAGVTAVLLLLVLGATLSVVGSTMRSILARRAVEVDVLRLVGADRRFIEKPFLIGGALQGAGGATLALLITAGAYAIAHSQVGPDLLAIMGGPPVFLPWHWVTGFIAIGAVLGALSGQLSVRKSTT